MRQRRLYVGDALETLRTFPSGGVHCCVTSPPYWGMRIYGCDAREIGNEISKELYIERLVAVFSEVKRVLHPMGTLWVNLGDVYVNKCLAGLPWLLAQALCADGWLWRNTIVWCKPNAPPESARDRASRAWEPVLMFAKNHRYYFDGFALREPAAYAPSRGPRDVWNITVGRSKGSYASPFPEDLAIRCVAAGCPQVVSPCGCPWERRTERSRTVDGVLPYAGPARSHSKAEPKSGVGVGHWRITTVVKDLGFEPRCHCGAEGVTSPGCVLDPFMGSGTVARVAERLGVGWVGIDLTNTNFRQ